MKEIWKDIPEYEELYQISNLGKEYLSAWDASRKIGAFQSNIWKAIHNGKKCNGYYWKYKEE